MTYLDNQPMFDEIEAEEKKAWKIWEEAKQAAEAARQLSARTRKPVISTTQAWPPKKPSF